jgi:hypothetical protein
VLDQDGRVVTGPTVVAVATPGWNHAVIAEPAGRDTRVSVTDLASARVLSVNTFQDRLEPRVVSANGHLVASVTPGGAGIYGLHEPGGRSARRLSCPKAGASASGWIWRQPRARGVFP